MGGMVGHPIYEIHSWLLALCMPLKTNSSLLSIIGKCRPQFVVQMGTEFK